MKCNMSACSSLVYYFVRRIKNRIRLRFLDFRLLVIIIISFFWGGGGVEASRCDCACARFLVSRKAVQVGFELGISSFKGNRGDH